MFISLILHITGSGVLCLQLGRPEVGRKLYTQGWRQRPVRLLDKVEIIKSIEQITVILKGDLFMKKMSFSEAQSVAIRRTQTNRSETLAVLDLYLYFSANN